MDIGVPSRFACLKIEDEPVLTKSKDKKVENKKTALKKHKEQDNKKTKNVINGKKDTNKPNRPKEKINTIKKEKKKEQTKEQWEEWKEKDSQLLNGHYEEDLQNAILLSKLDYEEKKDLYKQLEKEAELEKNRSQIKKKKNKVMSLDQFLGSGVNDDEVEVEKSNDVAPDEMFFDRIKQETQSQLNIEEAKEERKKREETIDEIISMAQLQDKLDRERKEKEKLRKQLDKAKSEISAVKERNKSLCDILGRGEMKDKADVLVELERLNSVKNELTEEVSRLHALLEQERSKVAALTEAQHSKHKDKKSKK